MKATDQFISMMDQQQREATLRNSAEQLEATIIEALAALREPLDTKAVLDNPWGRALWGSICADKAERILSRIEPSKVHPA